MLEMLSYTVPSIVTGVIAFYFFNHFIKNNYQKSNLELLAEKKKVALPIKLQAYERILLFCERINPIKMLLRVKPIGENSDEYLQLLLKNIEQEFEHNLVQQIYISDNSWTAVIAAKNAIINKLKQTAEKTKSANELRENILLEYTKTLPPTDTAIAFLKNEVRKLL